LQADIGIVLSRGTGRIAVSIVRVGLAETKRFSEGYEAIFGKKKAQGKAKTASAKKTSKGAKKKAKKK